jgi:hypothetical protein
MYELETLTGRVIEACRYLNRIPGLRDDDPSRERWELWLADANNNEHKIVVYSQCMPARVGHAVTIVHFEGRGAGLYNLSTGMRVNFVQADPPQLIRNIDVVIVVFGSFGALMGGAYWHPLVWLVVLPLLALYGPAVMLARRQDRTRLLKQVDDMLDPIQVEDVVKPFRPRR